MTSVAISFADVGVRYRLRRRNRRPHPAVRHASGNEFWGLRGISLEAGRGEYLGIIGGNGAGKTSLLRVGAGIIRPDEGTVASGGRVVPVLGVGTGVVVGLSGWENIELLGVLLGLSARSARAVAPAIGEFSGLAGFLDAPVRTYSLGMRARLGFAVATHVGADVLLLDEVTAVGDEEFRHRCAERLASLRGDGCTVLVATHDLDGLLDAADRVAWVDGGRLVTAGAPAEVVAAYRAAADDQGAGGLHRPNLPPGPPR